MHLVSLASAGSAAPGVLLGDDVLNLAAAAAALAEARAVPPTMLAILEGGTATLDVIRRVMDGVTGPAADQLREVGALVPRSGAALAAPIGNPGLVLAAGLN